MKRYINILCILFAVSSPMAFTGCQTAPASRTTTVVTLEVIGASVDATMKVAAGLYTSGKITTAQWNTITDIHDNKFLPAYNLAVQAVQSDLSSVASPDIQALADSLAAAVSLVTK